MGLDVGDDSDCRAWNTTDGGCRGRRLRVARTAGCRYSDPRVDDRDRTGLVGQIGMLLEKFPGSVIRRTSMIESHPAGLRFGFVRLAADGDVMREGTDFCSLGEGGRLQRITGF